MVVQKSSPHISFDGSESISLIRRNVSFFAIQEFRRCKL